MTWTCEHPERPTTWAIRAWETVAVQDTLPLPTGYPATVRFSDHGSLTLRR